MATIKSGILGGFSGSVGAVTGTSWKGIAVMKSKPISVLNPRTAAQVGNRTRFKSISLLGTAMLSSIVKPLNDRFAQKMSGFNLFCSRNANVFDTTGIFSGEKLVIASGKIGDHEITSLTRPSSNTCTISWNSVPSTPYALGTDKAYIAIVSLEGELIGTSAAEETRAGGGITIDCGGVSLDGAWVYLAFLRADGTMVSNTAFSQF